MTNQQEKAIRGSSRFRERGDGALKEPVDLRINSRHQILRVLSFTQFI